MDYQKINRSQHNFRLNVSTSKYTEVGHASSDQVTARLMDDINRRKEQQKQAMLQKQMHDEAREKELHTFVPNSHQGS